MSGVLKPGERFAGRYVVEDLIAEGGMASIFRARDEKQKRFVAVKVLYPYYADNRVIRARFIEEGRIQQMLVHPNVVLVYEVLEKPLSIVMEHVDGPTLDDYLAEQGQLAEAEILDISIAVMSALGLAHSKGIIHRDLKPSNILLNRTKRGFQPKVMDFGVAKVKDAKHDLTATGTTVGTLHYMSPEQIVGSKNIDGRADIYSLGVTMYKLVTGEVPFNAPTEFALMMAQVEAPPLPPSQLRPNLSPELERVILRSMAKKAADRFQSIREFATALLEMRRGSDRTVRDTITETISQELIDIAMAADEVAQDRTAEMNLRVIRSELLQTDPDGGAEPTVEMTRKVRGVDQSTEDQERDDSTVELSTSQIIRISSSDVTAEEAFDEQNASTAATAVMDRKIDKDGNRSDDSSQNITRPTRASRPLEPSGFVSESVDTESIDRRMRVEEGRVVVLDKDANSRDLTAPKISEAAYQRVLEKAKPSGPKVVLGYNPADTQDKTFEKPNYRTKLAQFETHKSTDHPLPPAQSPEPPRPRPLKPADHGGEMPRPGPPPHADDAVPPTPSPSRSSLIERVDAIAQSALQTAADQNVPTWLVLGGFFGVLVLLAGVTLLVFWQFLG